MILVQMNFQQICLERRGNLLVETAILGVSHTVPPRFVRIAWVPRLTVDERDQEDQHNGEEIEIEMKLHLGY